MIPDEAVEAASARIFASESLTYLRSTVIARAALEAAAPYIQAQAWDECVSSMVYEDGTVVELATNNNPYRSQQ